MNNTLSCHGRKWWYIVNTERMDFRFWWIWTHILLQFLPIYVSMWHWDSYLICLSLICKMKIRSTSWSCYKLHKEMHIIFLAQSGHTINIGKMASHNKEHELWNQKTWVRIPAWRFVTEWPKKVTSPI